MKVIAYLYNSNTRRMKKGIIIISIILIAGCGLVIWKWDTWFSNQPEMAYTTPLGQDRIILSMGENALTTRRISWRCDTSLTRAYVEMVQANTTDTIRYDAQGDIVSSRAGKSAFYRTEITGLIPDSIYQYRVVNERKQSRHTERSDWYTFRMPQENDELSFIYLGDIQDPGNGKTGEQFKCIRRQYPDVDFWAFVGDIIERPMDNFWTYWFATMDSIAPATPIMAATGNHEYLKGLPKVLDPRWTYSFNNPENGPDGFEGQSYFVNFKDLCYIVIDTDGIQGPISLYNHRHWLENVLKNSDKKWKIVMMHHPVYSVRDSRNNYYVRWTFKPLFEKYGVNLVLQGHDHGYSRITTKTTEAQKIAPVYIISSCSPKHYTIGFDQRHDRLGANLDLYQYITIRKDTLDFKACTIDNEMYDHIQLLQNGEVIDKAIGWPEKLETSFGDSPKAQKKVEKYNRKVQERQSRKTI